MQSSKITQNCGCTSVAPAAAEGRAIISARDILSLPRGVTNADRCIQVNVTDAFALEAAACLIGHNDATPFATQSQAIAYCTQRYGFGALGQLTSNPAAPGQAAAATSGGTCMLKAPQDALQLAKGTLAVGYRSMGTMYSPGGTIVDTAFSPSSVLECAQILIAKGDTRTYETQAQVIQIAGNCYGWGRGRDYFAR